MCIVGIEEKANAFFRASGALLPDNNHAVSLPASFRARFCNKLIISDAYGSYDTVCIFQGFNSQRVVEDFNNSLSGIISKVHAYVYSLSIEVLCSNLFPSF